MASAPTIFYLTDHISAAYFPQGRSGTFISQPPTSGTDLGMRVETLLAALPGTAKQVYVVTTEVWSQSLSMESRAVRRIEKEQLPQMLAFEAQALSGLGVQQARTATKMLQAKPQETDFWISQLDASLYLQLAEAVSYLGGRLQGVLHPAGLPRPLATTAQTAAWCRLEVWDDASLLVTGGRRKAPSYFFLGEQPAEPLDAEHLQALLAAHSLDDSTADIEAFEIQYETTSDFWKADANDWQQEDLSDESDSTSPVATRRALVSKYDLGTEADLQQLLEGWSVALARDPGVPVLRPLRHGRSQQDSRTIIIGLAAAALVFIVGHYLWSGYANRQQVEMLTGQVKSLQLPIQQYDASKKSLKSLETKLAQAQAHRDRLQNQLDRYSDNVDVHRSRLVELLQLISAHRPADLVIRQVECDGNTIRITGRSLGTDSANALARNLAVELRKWNLTLEVPRTEFISPGPYEFEYVIRDLSRG